MERPKRKWSEVNSLNLASLGLAHTTFFWLLIWDPEVRAFPNNYAVTILTWLSVIVVVATFDALTKHRTFLTFLFGALCSGLSVALIEYASILAFEARSGSPSKTRLVLPLIVIGGLLIVPILAYLFYFVGWLARRWKQAHSNKQVRGEAK